MTIEWAHQGGAREAPSNTMWAMKQALARAGNRSEVGLECDVHLSADHRLVVMHDAALERTTNGRGRLRRQPYRPGPTAGPHARGIADAHAGWWWRFGEVDDHGQGPYPLRAGDTDLLVPTIEDVLALKRRGPLTIEIKSFAAARRLAWVLQDQLRATGRLNGTFVVVTSFSSLRIRRFYKEIAPEHLHPDGPIQLAPGLAYLLLFKLCVALGIPVRSKRYQRIQIPVQHLKLRWATPRFMAAAEKAGLLVDVWTVDDPPTMRGLLALGVDGIMTDRPTVLRDVIRGS